MVIIACDLLIILFITKLCMYACMCVFVCLRVFVCSCILSTKSIQNTCVHIDNKDDDDDDEDD